MNFTSRTIERNYLKPRILYIHVLCYCVFSAWLRRTHVSQSHGHHKWHRPQSITDWGQRCQKGRTHFCNLYFTYLLF